MSKPKRWIIHPPHPAADALANQLRTSPLLAQTLANRGLLELTACQEFLNPSLKNLHEPSALANLDRAAQRLATAIKTSERIVIYGDYDVDGITASAILFHAIRALGGNADYYIPNRIDEGYGLNCDAIQQICDDGARLIVSVDCGVTAIAPAAVARACGVDLIITDHHEFLPAGGSGESLPDCYAIVHPRLPGVAAYPYPWLCGAGVAFKLAWGLGQAMHGRRVNADYKQFLVQATALAGLGTIADVVPLTGENRIIAHAGLTQMAKSPWVGLDALIAVAGLNDKPIDSHAVGFRLAPRLNASGRMDDARLAVELLTINDSERAREIADHLDAQNRERQAIQKTIFEAAVAQVEAGNLDRDDCRGYVFSADDWHPGIIGIVASKLVERYGRPTVMIALHEGIGHGSARSIAGFHLANALNECHDLLISHGGHEMAAGCRIDAANLDAFRRAFADYAARLLSPDMLAAALEIECLIELRQLNESLVRQLGQLGPFGNANGMPIFAARSVEVATPPRAVGRDAAHLQMQVRQGSAQLACIGFGYGELAATLSVGQEIDIAFEAAINEYNGRSSVQLVLRDVQMQS